MHIYDIKVTSGPNTWSVDRQKLVIMTLDLSGFPHKLSNEIPGFNDRLKKVMPSLASHGCHYNGPLSFFPMLDAGLRLDHVIEHVAVELLKMAGVECPFARCYIKSETICEIALGYERENVVVHAATAAVRIVERIIKGIPCHVSLDVDEIRSVADDSIGRHIYERYWAPPIPIQWI